MFKKILIANRGEIACRIMRTAQQMDIRCVAVYSDADRTARHVRMSDEAVWIGAAAAAESYLCIDKIVDAARRTGAQAIHPGYGFLSENEKFAQACADNGIVFIGPPIAAIAAMGSKSAAKTLMEQAGVPLTPGYHGTQQDEAFLRQQADAIGYPVLIKASAGGGGKGMRIVTQAADFADALAACKREARASFGDDQVLLEKYLLRPRHIEVQVFGDTHGNYVYLFERDCSVQRRHQKVLEEAPAPGMSEERRAQMGQVAVNAAKAVGYVGAGTVEFIATADFARNGEFYFMEMNTRLQVEHPVTEMVTGQDLVAWQLRVAAGEKLPLSQAELSLHGHAIEARIYAEDPGKGFLPSAGKLLHLAPPDGLHVRIDSGVEEGDLISPFYDPMIAKLIVWGESRPEALARMQKALSEYRVVGLANNISFLARLVGCDDFVAAELATDLIERQAPALLFASHAIPDTAYYLGALYTLLREQASVGDERGPWQLRDGWRMNLPAQRVMQFCCEQEDESGARDKNDASDEAVGVRRVQIAYAQNAYSMQLGGRCVSVQASMNASSPTWAQIDAYIDGSKLRAHMVEQGRWLHIFACDAHWTIAREDPGSRIGSAHHGEASLLAPMPGKIIALLATAGVPIDKGTPLLILEAMKMEHTITAPADGMVKAYCFEIGEQVGDGAQLVEFAVAADA